jgi:hypothetical protein
MKKILLLIAIIFTGSQMMAQVCDPESYDWGTATFGVSPDPNAGESFLVGHVGQAYYDVIYVKCPTVAGDVLGPDHPWYQLVATAALDSVRLNSITLDNGLAEIPLSDIGLNLTCNNGGQSSNPCMFYPGNNYCGDITGTPTAAGEWPVTITITAYFDNSQATWLPAQLDYPLEGYTLIVDGEVSVNETAAANFNVEQNVPNPANNYTRVSFTVPNAEDASVTITNLIGEVVRKKAVKSKKGENTVDIDTSDIPSGIYLYSVQTASKKITKRMVIQH